MLVPGFEIVDGLAEIQVGVKDGVVRNAPEIAGMSAG